MDKHYQSNLTKYLVISILHGAAVSTSIVLWVVFLQRQYGFSLTEVTLLDLPFWISKFIFEIPTGVVADRYGRKLSLAISAALTSVTWLAFAMFGSFLVLALAQFLGGLAATFESGANEALLFETVQALGRTGEYAKISGRMKAAETASSMISGIVVGFIASYSLLLPVVLTSIIFGMTLFPILTLKETGARFVGNKRLRPGYRQIVLQAYHVLRDQAAVRWAAVYLVVLACVAFYAVTFLQPYALAIGLAVVMLGPVMVGYQALGIIGSLSIERFQKAFGNQMLMLSAPLILIPCLLGIAAMPVIPILSLFALSSFMFSMINPVLFAVIQRYVSDEARATLLSIQSLLFTIFLIVTEPALGVLSDRYGVHTSYFAMAGLIAAICLPLLWIGRHRLQFT